MRWISLQWKLKGDKMPKGICPKCGRQLGYKHTMFEGITYFPCSHCEEPELDEETLRAIKKAVGVEC